MPPALNIVMKPKNYNARIIEIMRQKIIDSTPKLDRWYDAPKITYALAHHFLESPSTATLDMLQTWCKGAGTVTVTFLDLFVKAVAEKYNQSALSVLTTSHIPERSLLQTAFTTLYLALDLPSVHNAHTAISTRALKDALSCVLCDVAFVLETLGLNNCFSTNSLHSQTTLFVPDCSACGAPLEYKNVYNHIQKYATSAMLPNDFDALLLLGHSGYESPYTTLLSQASYRSPSALIEFLSKKSV